MPWCHCTELDEQSIANKSPYLHPSYVPSASQPIYRTTDAWTLSPTLCSTLLAYTLQIPPTSPSPQSLHHQRAPFSCAIFLWANGSRLASVTGLSVQCRAVLPIWGEMLDFLWLPHLCLRARHRHWAFHHLCWWKDNRNIRITAILCKYILNIWV